MKTIPSLLLFALLQTTAFAQTNVHALNDTLVARYNREDFQGFYDLGSAEWKSKNKPDGIFGWLGYMKSITGQISHPVFSHSSHDTTYFTWDGQEKMTSFLLKSGGSVFEGFDFKDYHFPPSAALWQTVPTDNPLRTRLDSVVQAFIADFMLTHKLIGVSVGLVKDGKKYSYNYGTVEKGKSELPTSNTTFELASITKTFTGILLAQAVLDKKISLNDDIRHYMDGDFPNLQYNGTPIRIVNLANHTSGLPAELPNLDNYKSSFDVLKMYDQYTDDKFFSDLRQVKIDTLPGTTYGYSNSGVKLLGIILAKVYGKNYNELLQQYICVPMKMKDTRTAFLISDTTSYTKGYDGLGNPMPHLNFNMFGGAGSILSNVQDMMNYVAANISEKLPAVRLAHQPTFEKTDEALGLCWQINRKTVNGTRIWKSGGALGFRSYCAVVPEEKMGIIWLSNRSAIMEDDLSDMVDRLFQAALTPVQTPAQTPQEPKALPYYHSTPQKLTDLIDTRLDVRFDYSKSWLYGKEWVTLKPHFYPTDSLKLDARYMDIKKIAIVRNGQMTPLQYQYDSIYLNIRLDRTYKRNERYTIYIAYTSKPDNVHDRPGFRMDGKGLWFINPTGADPDKPTQIWTQGEAESSSCWFPTIDHPNQKTTDRISMTVPEKYTTLSNGLLISQKPNGDGTRTDTWKQSLPHSPYLFMMAIGEFRVYHDKWRNKNVDYYLEPAYFPYAKQIFGQTPEMIELFSRTLGVDFPWEKYAQVVVRDYPFGAMENTSATLHNDYVQNRPWELIDDPNGSGGTTIAHELFHQWFGDYVTCESWSNETLNESFAVFGGKFWNEKKYGKDDGDSKRFEEMNAYLNNPTASGQALTPFVYTDEEGVNGANIYDKGGIVINMLRTYLGDSAFFKGLNLYLRTRAFSNAEVHDLRLAMEEVSGQDLNWFFNQWYYGTGHPVLDISYQWDVAQKKETVVIRQKQEGQVFQIPMAVDCYTGNQVIRKNVWLSQPIDTLSFDLPGQPDLVNVDADKQLLCKKTDHKTIAEFVFQYQHAPRYLDRLEAINTGDPAIATAALQDRYYGLRIKAIRSLKMDSAALAMKIAPTLVSLATNDSNYLVRAAAIKALVKASPTGYLTLYKEALRSPSYTVKGAALNAINSTDSSEALSIAKSLAADNKGQLGTAILTVYATSGSDAEWPAVIEGFNKGGGQAKYDLANGPMATMLTRLSNKQYVTEGIDAIRDLAIRYKKYGMAPKLITTLQAIGDARRKQGDEASAAAAEDAIKKINEGKG